MNEAGEAFAAGTLGLRSESIEEDGLDVQYGIGFQGFACIRRLAMSACEIASGAIGHLMSAAHFGKAAIRS
ncbi:MAG TPA: hypothetical protein VKP66_14935 [Steroidobacteraceae bacterium]|nr:hypothetical protein [Steroidobacteraceae bacterium]